MFQDFWYNIEQNFVEAYYSKAGQKLVKSFKQVFLND